MITDMAISDIGYDIGYPISISEIRYDFFTEKNKWFPWAFWWNLFEFFCNGDLPMTASRGLASLGGASVERASLRSVEPRFARRDGLASLGWRPLKTVPPRANPPGDCTRSPVTHRSVTHWTSGVVPPEGKPELSYRNFYRNFFFL